MTTHEYYVEYYERLIALGEMPEVDGCIYTVENDKIVAYDLNIPSTTISYTIPDMIEIIDTHFWESLDGTNLYDLHTSNVYKLESVKLGNIGKIKSLFLDNVIEMAENQFLNCTNLSSVIAPKLKVIPSGTFDNCSCLYYLDAPNVEKCFANLNIKNFRTLTIPSSNLTIDSKEDELIAEESVTKEANEKFNNIGRSDFSLLISALSKIFFNRV